MTELIYQWKIDFALILSIAALLIASIRWYFEKRNKKKNKILEAYEKVFDDSIFILLYPLKFRKELANKKQFTDSDTEFEKAVRNYRNSHMMARSFSHLDKYVPASIVTQTDKLKYLLKVSDAASQFERKVSEEQFDLNLPNMSPVNYFENEEVNHKFQNIVQVVGKNLSLFSEDIQRYWSDTLTENPDDVKREYQKCLDVHSEYFTYNLRDFADPYYDLLQQIIGDYRRMTRKITENIGWKTKLFINKVFHPIKTYNKHKENKGLLS